MEESHPVADFVGGGLAEVVVCCGAAWRGGVQDGAAVILFICQSVTPSQFLTFQIHSELRGSVLKLSEDWRLT